MHFDTLRHVRDHVKTVGPARHLLNEIAMHVNYHTGEAFALSVERLAHRLDVTPQWARQLLRTVLDAGELLVVRSRGRYPNRYRFPLERCHACQAGASPGVTPPDANPKLELPVEINPQVELPVDTNPKLDPPQPDTNPKLESASGGPLARLEPPKDVKDVKEKEKRHHVNVADRRWDQCAQVLDEAYTEGFLDQVAEALQDWKPLSRRTYRHHLAAFGEAVMWRMVSYTKEAYLDGRVETSPGRYYMGVVRAERARINSEQT